MRIPLITMIALLGLTACSSADPRVTSEARTFDPAEAGSDAIPVTLREYELGVSVNVTDAGTIEFLARNAGQVEHQLVMVPVQGGRFGDPVADTGALAVGESRGIRIALSPGTYELVCLLTFSDLDTGTWDSHMALGMRATMVITE